MENKQYSREELVKIILDSDKSDLDYDEKEITALILETKVTKNINEAHEKRLTRGDVMADKLASFAGSWFFISIFVLIIILWISANILLRQQIVRSLPVHPAEPDSLLRRGPAGARDHDEPEPAGTERPTPLQE